MTTIEIEVPAGLADEADALRAAILELLDTAAPGGLSAITGLLESLVLRESVLRRVTDAVANQPLPIGPASAGQYAELVGAAPTSRSVASKAKAKGLVGYRRGRRILYPAFQFDARGLRPGWRDVVAPLRDAGWADEDIVLWLAAPHGSLGRRSPVESLNDGELALVLHVVRDEAAGLW